MNRLRELREDRDLRQVDVSYYVGIDQKTLSNYETGKTNPDSQSLIKLADFYNVSIDYLVGRVQLDAQADARGDRRHCQPARRHEKDVISKSTEKTRQQPRFYFQAI